MNIQKNSKQEVDENKEYKLMDINAKVSIEIPYSYYVQMFEAATFMLEGKTKEQMADYQNSVKNNTAFTEQWMQHYHTLLLFCSVFQKECADRDLLVTMKGSEILEKYKEQES